MVYLDCHFLSIWRVGTLTTANDSAPTSCSLRPQMASRAHGGGRKWDIGKGPNRPPNPKGGVFKLEASPWRLEKRRGWKRCQGGGWHRGRCAALVDSTRARIIEEVSVTRLLDTRMLAYYGLPKRCAYRGVLPRFTVHPTVYIPETYSFRKLIRFPPSFELCQIALVQQTWKPVLIDLYNRRGSHQLPVLYRDALIQWGGKSLCTVHTEVDA